VRMAGVMGPKFMRLRSAWMRSAHPDLTSAGCGEHLSRASVYRAFEPADMAK
jgi:hypothetical protein